MQHEIVIAGFGGQGVLFAGQLLATAAIHAEKETTWIPSYGPEMRGGTANCTVMISDEEIGSPHVQYPGAVIAMNQPSLDKYEPWVHPGGLLVFNTSLIERPVTRTEIRSVGVPANEIAESIGDRRMTNMVLIGALLGNLDLFSLEIVEQALAAILPARHQKLLPLNYECLHRGAQFHPVIQ